MPNQHTDSEGTPSATRCGDTKVRENSEEVQAIWEGLPAAKKTDGEYVWERIDQGASSPRCPDGRTREHGTSPRPAQVLRAGRSASVREGQMLMFGDKDVECDLLAGVRRTRRRGCVEISSGRVHPIILHSHFSTSGSIERWGTGTATPSSRYHEDGVEVDATSQHNAP